MINDIQRFLQVVELTSVTKAAKQLHLTQPALSLSLQRLEKELQQTLFIHAGRELTLTNEGKSFYRIAKRISELWEQAKETIQNDTPTIRLGTYDNAALQLADFVTQQLSNKTYQLEVVIDRSSHILADVSKGLIDIGICVMDRNTAIPNNTIMIHSFSEELIPMGKQTYTKTIETIPFILYNFGSLTRKAIDQTFLQHSIRPTIIAQSTSITFMKQLALSGSGVALLPKNFIVSELKEKLLLKQSLPFSFSREIGIFLRKDGKLQKKDALVENILTFF